MWHSAKVSNCVAINKFLSDCTLGTAAGGGGGGGGPPAPYALERFDIVLMRWCLKAQGCGFP